MPARVLTSLGEKKRVPVRVTRNGVEYPDGVQWLEDAGAYVFWFW